MELHELDLTDSTRGVLEKRGITDLPSLLAFREDFTQIKGVGKARGEELESALQASEIGRQQRFEPPPQEPPQDEGTEEDKGEEVAPEPDPFVPKLGDLVMYTTEHMTPRWARAAGIGEDRSLSLTVFTQGGSWNETGIPYSKTPKPKSWRFSGEVE
jgi:hypothetical protein